MFADLSPRLTPTLTPVLRKCVECVSVPDLLVVKRWPADVARSVCDRALDLLQDPSDDTKILGAQLLQQLPLDVTRGIDVPRAAVASPRVVLALGDVAIDHLTVTDIAAVSRWPEPDKVEALLTRLPHEKLLSAAPELTGSRLLVGLIIAKGRFPPLVQELPRGLFPSGFPTNILYAYDHLTC